MRYEPLQHTGRPCPSETFRALRDQDALPYAPDAGVFLVTRYDEAEEVFKDTERFSSRTGFDLFFQDRWTRVGPRDVLEMARFLRRARVNPLRLRRAPESLLTSDGGSHTAMRSIVNRGFTSRRIAAWEPRIRELCENAVAALDADAGFDVVATVAHPLPMTIVAEMLGVEPERRADFRRWSHGLVATATGSRRESSPAPFLATAGEMLSYLRGVVDARRREPADDLISTLVDPRHEETLDTDAVLVFATLLLVAGNETTTNAIGNAVHLLLEHPEILQAVADDPALIPNVVEETVRLESPFQFMPRVATCATELRGTRIAEGDRLLVMIGAANRDERRFSDPDRFDPHRDTRGHLGFGHGVHFCLGASLARLEARCALEALVPELAERALEPGGQTRADSFLTHGFAELRVGPRRLTRAA